MHSDGCVCNVHVPHFVHGQYNNYYYDHFNLTQDILLGLNVAPVKVQVTQVMMTSSIL